MISCIALPQRECPNSQPCVSHRHLARRMTMPRVAQSVAAVRCQVRDLMRRWDIQDIADDAELMTSELAANAVQRTTRSHYTVAIRVSAGLLIVEVFDDEPRMPALGEPDLSSECGRGLAALAALAKDWGRRAARLANASGLPSNSRLPRRSGQTRRQLYRRPGYAHRGPALDARRCVTSPRRSRPQEDLRRSIVSGMGTASQAARRRLQPDGSLLGVGKTALRVRWSGPARAGGTTGCLTTVRAGLRGRGSRGVS